MATSFDEVILGEVAQLLEPFQLAVDSAPARRRLLAAVGVDFEVVTGLDLTPLTTAVSQFVGVIDQLEQAPGAVTLVEVATTLQVATQAFSSLRQLFAGLTSASLPADLAATLPALGERLLDYLVVTWLRGHHPLAYALLDALGGVDWTIPSSPPVITSAGIAYQPTVAPSINLQRLLQLVRDPVATLKAFYLGGTSGQAAVDALTNRLWPRLAAICDALNWPVAVGLTPGLQQSLGGQLGAVGTQLGNAAFMVPLAVDANGDVVMLALTLSPAQTSSERSLLLLGLSGAASQSFSGKTWQVDVQVLGTLQGFGVDSGGTVILPPSASTADSLSIRVAAARPLDPSLPLARLGGSTGTRLEIGTVSSSVALDFVGIAPSSAQVEVTASGVTLVVDFSDGDGFLRYLAEHLLGGPLRANVDVTVGWSGTRGVYLRAGGSANSNGARQLRARIPVNLTLGPVSVPAVVVAATPSDAELELSAGVEATVSLGPVVATVVGFGLGIHASAPSAGGNLGPLDLQLRLQPPDGIALSISAPGVSGTGYLQPGPAPGDYLGAVDLKVGQVHIAGVGVLTTRIPGGPAFSLVVLVSAEFPPIDVGFGFALVGVGGLLGLNRTMDVPRLQELARGGGLDDLMFPADLAHNAPRVASDLGNYFPPAEGQFVIGPTARLIWGESGFLSADIAVLIELPAPLRIAVLGTIRLALPNPESAVVDVTLDVLGIIDLSASTLSLDASLRKSSIGGLKLTGQAAVRARFGTNPSFMLAVGGFNPHFSPPAEFPALSRVMLSAGSDNPRLRMAAYLALTSNTLQFGARADLYASVGPAAVAATLNFDALVQHKPLSLVVDLSISAIVFVNDSPVLGLRLDLHISGPAPWHILGQAQFQILTWSYTVPIDLTVGPAAPLQPPATVDVLAKLADALNDIHNWQLTPPAGAGVVALRPGNPADDPAVHPLGQLSVRQRVVPLQVSIDRFGPDPLPAPSRLDLTNPRLNAVGVPLAATNPVTDYFAPAQFVTMTDADKLAAPSFEQMDAGLAIGTPVVSVPNDTGVAAVVVSTRQWTTVTVDSPDAALAAPTMAALSPTPTAGVVASGLSVSTDTSTAPATDLVRRQLGGAAAALNGTGSRGAAAYTGRPSGMAVNSPRYAAARLDPIQTMSLLSLGARPLSNLSSRVQAKDLLGRVSSNGAPVQVIFNSELPGWLPPTSVSGGSG